PSTGKRAANWATAAGGQRVTLGFANPRAIVPKRNEVDWWTFFTLTRQASRRNPALSSSTVACRSRRRTPPRCAVPCARSCGRRVFRRAAVPGRRQAGPACSARDSRGPLRLLTLRIHRGRGDRLNPVCHELLRPGQTGDGAEAHWPARGALPTQSRRQGQQPLFHAEPAHEHGPPLPAGVSPGGQTLRGCWAPFGLDAAARAGTRPTTWRSHGHLPWCLTYHHLVAPGTDLGA